MHTCLKQFYNVTYTIVFKYPPSSNRYKNKSQPVHLHSAGFQAPTTFLGERSKSKERIYYFK